MKKKKRGDTIGEAISPIIINIDRCDGLSQTLKSSLSRRRRRRKKKKVYFFFLSFFCFYLYGLGGGCGCVRRSALPTLLSLSKTAGVV